MIQFNPLRGKEFISSLETNDETHLEDEEEEDLDELNDDYESNN